ncbi:hypothetical protein [Chitinimonas sp. BJB300]|uniref:hypothetical protein n=1 Tax=Chitinimonas sp. BJB300 TaxID=1559339 RepID=UPI0013041ACD|nr:hypothetical protein [Chitinimonas sp. BJB300]
MPPSPADLPKALVQLFDPTALFDSYTRLYTIQVAWLARRQATSRILLQNLGN